jgi:hypothetical protein
MKAILSVLVLAASSVAMTAPAKAADPCEQVLCLYGVMTTGNVASGCKGPVGDYFNIIEKKHGSFLPDHTSRKRKNSWISAHPLEVMWLKKLITSLAACAGCDQRRIICRI